MTMISDSCGIIIWRILEQEKAGKSAGILLLGVVVTEYMNTIQEQVT